MWIYTRWNMTSMQQKAYRGVLPELRQCPRRQSINNHSINTMNNKKPYLVFKVYAVWHSRMLHHLVGSPVLKNGTIDRRTGLDREALVRAIRLFDTKRIKIKTGLDAFVLAVYSHVEYVPSNSRVLLVKLRVVLRNRQSRVDGVLLRGVVTNKTKNAVQVENGSRGRLDDTAGNLDGAIRSDPFENRPPPPRPCFVGVVRIWFPSVSVSQKDRAKKATIEIYAAKHAPANSHI